MIRESVSVVADGIRIAGEVYIPGTSTEETYPGICLCHGVPARVKDPQDMGYQLLAEKFCREGFAVLIFNFRGTGASEGNFDISGWTRDLVSMIDFFYTHPNVDKKRISLMGFSGGAAVSVYVTAHDSRLFSLVTCACPSEFSLMSQPERVNLFIDHAKTVGIIRDRHYPLSLEDWLKGFEEVSPIKWVDRISPRPIFIIHGTDDDTINVSHAWRLYENAKDPKEISIIKGAEHGIRKDKRAILVALQWLKKINAMSPDIHQKLP